MIEPLSAGNEEEYTRFVLDSPETNYCHDLGWKKVFEGVYNKQAHYLLYRKVKDEPISGVAPAFFLKSFLFGRSLTCLPYLDLGGPIAETPEGETALLDALKKAVSDNGAEMELRCRYPLMTLPAPENVKVNMVLSLEGLDEEKYWKGLNAKVRNQVRKAEKSKVTQKWGKLPELIDDFYRVFCVNMRDLGSPVHSKQLFSKVLKQFPGAEVGAAYKDGLCIGGLVRILWKKTLVIPWASTLREFRTHCPNNALYYDSIKYAFAKGCHEVDFGRSSKGEGTYKFKKQWQAEDSPLCWYQFDRQGNLKTEASHAAEGKMALAADIWAKFPLWLANGLGPRLRGYISA